MYHPPMSDEHRRRAVTTDWISKVEAILKAQGHGSRTALASCVGCDPSSITQILRGEKETSRLVEPISECLGIRLPALEDAEAVRPSLLSKVAQLGDEGQEAIEAIVDRMLGKKP